MPGSPYVTCSICGAKSLDPIPTESYLSAYYNGVYTVPREDLKKSYEKKAPRILSELRNNVATGVRLLEIGCSYGFLLDYLRQHGWDVTGVEIDDRAASFARHDLSLNVHTGSLENARLSPPYDAILSFDVIEHLRYPMDFLRQCRSLLRDNGIIILTTANVASWIAKVTGQYWCWHSAPAHIHLPTPRAMELAAAKSGFQVTTLRTERGDAGNNLFECITALGRRWRSQGSNVRSRPISNGTQWLVRRVSAITDIVYIPFALTIAVWMAHRLLQPELLLIAKAAKRGDSMQ